VLHLKKNIYPSEVCVYLIFTDIIQSKFIVETTYKILIQTGSLQKDINIDNANFYIIIYGENDQTKKLYLKSDKTNSFNKDEKTEFEFTTNDVGKVSVISIISLLFFV
jgi:hypothetical protein